MTLQKMISRLDLLLHVELYQLDGARVTVGRFLVAVLAFLAFFLISYLVRRSVRSVMKKKGVINQQTLETTCNFLHWVVMIVGAVVGLKVAGIDLSTLFAAGAVLTVGLGFAMQNIAQNFVSGIILFTERSIQPDDILAVDGVVVKIRKIGIRATHAVTRTSEELIIPNSNLVQGTVTNYTMTNANHSINTTVGVTYGSDMAKVKDVLQQTAEKMSWRIAGGDVLVLMSQFGNSSVDFTVYLECDNPWRARRFRGELNAAIWWAFKEHDITIAFPQLDVHFDSDNSLALARAAQAE